MTNREKAMVVLTNFGHEPEDLAGLSNSELADLFLAIVDPEWSDVMPELPEPPPERQKVVGYLRVRKWDMTKDPPERLWWKGGFVMVEWFADGHPQEGEPPDTRGHFYAHFNVRGQTGHPTIPEGGTWVQKLQLRKDPDDGVWKVWGRKSTGHPWELISEGWEWAGWGILPPGTI